MVLAILTVITALIVSYSLYASANMSSLGVTLTFKTIGIACATNLVAQVPITVVKAFRSETLTIARMPKDRQEIV